MSEKRPMKFNGIPQTAAGEPASTSEDFEAIAHLLYQLLDDIDTAGDLAKGDDKLYREIVERTQKKKIKAVFFCDGYVLKFKRLA